MTSAHVESPPRIVVGVDGSKQSKQALRWAARIAATTGARIDAIAAWQFPVGYGWGAVPLEWSPGQDMEKVLTESVDEVFGGDRPEDMRLAVHEGGAARVLLEESEGALMLVVGSRGHGGFAGMLLGSVSASVAEHANCPVLVVHGDSVLPDTTQ
jgi:nucleotide-binding universal stress UspA family protein